MVSVPSLDFMNSNYDEDLQVNPFLVALQEHRKEVFYGAVKSNWIICVPKNGSFRTNEFNEDDFLSHVLVELDPKQFKFKSLKNQTVIIKDNVLTTGKGFDYDKQVAVLFDESFYLAEGKSFKVCCISEPLNRSPADINSSNANDQFVLDTIEDCTDLLWGHSGNETLHRKVDGLIHFHCHELDSVQTNDVNVYKEGFLQLHKRAFTEVVHDKIVKRIIKHNPEFQNHLRLALEIYILDKIYKTLFHALTNITAKQDASLNKVTRNWHDIRSNKAGIKPEISTNIPRARRILSQIHRQTFPIGKCNCLKRTVKSLVDIKHALTSSDISESHVVTSDDVLSVLVFLIIKSDISNWYTHLLFSREFRFSRSQGDDERDFLLSTLEASLEYVSSLASKICEYDSLTTEKPMMEPAREEKSPLLELFSMIERGEVSTARDQLLRGHKVAFNLDYCPSSPSTNRSPVSRHAHDHRHCDPLCQCDTCRPERSKPSAASLRRKSTLFGGEIQTGQIVRENSSSSLSSLETSIVTSYSKDERAWTALHVASLHGQMKLTTLILELGAEIDARDVQGRTPLHLACAQGHQDIIFLLLEAGVNINLADSDGYRPIHIATERGHEMCVKTLLYFGASNSNLSIDAPDARGNSALHLAAKWGYEYLIELLLECGASPELRNHYEELPYQVANTQQLSRKLKHILKEYYTLNQKQISLTSSTDSNRSLCNSEHHLESSTSMTAPSISATNRRLGSESQVKLDSDHRRSSVMSQKKQSASVSDPYSVSMPTPQKRLNKTEVTVMDQIERDSLALIDAKSSRNAETASNVDQQIQKMLKAAADGDLQMVCHYLGISSQSEGDEDLEAIDMTQELCHPLCQCVNCLPIQKLMISVNSGSVQINSSNSSGFSALHIATISGHVTLVQFLLNRGADINLKTTNLGCTAVHFAALYNHLEIMLYLIKSGADIHSKDCQGNTPLHYAASKGHAALVATLIQQGSNVNSLNNKWNTPLHESARRGHIRVTRFLLWNGANPTAKNKQHMTPEYLAANPQVTQCIENYVHDKIASSMNNESVDSSWVIMQSYSKEKKSKLKKKLLSQVDGKTDYPSLDSYVPPTASINEEPVSDNHTIGIVDSCSSDHTKPSLLRRNTIEVDAGDILFDTTPPSSLSVPSHPKEEEDLPHSQSSECPTIQEDNSNEQPLLPSSYVLIHSTESDSPSLNDKVIHSDLT